MGDQPNVELSSTNSRVRDSYDTNAELYAELFLRDLDGDEWALTWLRRFAELTARNDGPVADMGCGPGHVVSHLMKLGVDATGYDISPGQIAQARAAFPEYSFQVGDFMTLDLPDSSLSGIVSRYSVIHLEPSRLGSLFEKWATLLQPDAPLLVSFFGATSPTVHGTAFDHKVTTAYALFPATVAEKLRDAGFTEIEIDTRPPVEGGRPFDQATVLALGGGDRRQRP